MPCALFFTILFVVGLASGMEFKDKQYGNKWDWLDWLDWLATVLGGLVGQSLQILFIWLIFL